MTKAKNPRPHIPLKDCYSVDDVANLLGICTDTVRKLASKGDDPLPFVRLSGHNRGMFILRAEFVSWLKRNAHPVSDGEARKGRCGK